MRHVGGVLNLLRRLITCSSARSIRNGRTLTATQLAIVLAPYIIRPTKTDDLTLDSTQPKEHLEDALIEPSKCIDSPKPIGFPLTPRRREIVRSDWCFLLSAAAMKWHPVSL